MSRFIRIFASGDVTLSCLDENEKERKIEKERESECERERKREGFIVRVSTREKPRKVDSTRIRGTRRAHPGISRLANGGGRLTKILGFNFLHPYSRAHSPRASA